MKSETISVVSWICGEFEDFYSGCKYSKFRFLVLGSLFIVFFLWLRFYGYPLSYLCLWIRGWASVVKVKGQCL